MTRVKSAQGSKRSYRVCFRAAEADRRPGARDPHCADQGYGPLESAGLLV